MAPIAPHSPAHGSNPAVLYVEDHPVNVLLMQALFAKRPHLALRVATTGGAAWELARWQPFDLLLLDLHLPDCHGCELLQRLRTLPALATVPAVAVTADVTADVERAGFATAWRKPMDVAAALASLDRLLAERADGHACLGGTASAGASGWTGPTARGSAPGPMPLSSVNEE